MGNREIIVIVSGGVVQEVRNIPEGIVVKIVDYDNEGADEDKFSEFEEIPCFISTVVGNSNN